MSTNISKLKREVLLAKIKEIRTFISAAPQDENTGNMLSYLSDLEKDVNGKKYGLVVNLKIVQVKIKRSSSFSLYAIVKFSFKVRDLHEFKIRCCKSCWKKLIRVKLILSI